MAAGLTLKLCVLLLVMMLILTDDHNSANGWLFWGKRKKGGRKATGTKTEFGVYTCSLIGLSKRKCEKRGLLPYAPYGLKHTFIKLHDKCYEWGDWNKARHLKCTDEEVACCYAISSRQYRGYTYCANRIGEFENEWEGSGKRYGLWSWNCQRYTNAMKDFLVNCYLHPSDAMP